MTETKLSFVNGKWIEDINSEFQLDNYLISNLDKVKNIVYNKDFDAVIIIDGIERAGKSVLAMMCAWYLSDCNLSINNFARGLSDAAKKVQQLPDKSVLILDEGSLVFNSKNSLNKEVKILHQLMDVCGQKNLIFIICLPSFFDLSLQIATRRSKFLIRVSVDENYNRGTMFFWGEKEKDRLYRKGKKEHNNYFCVPYNWVGHFKPYYLPFYQDYKEIVKKESLNEVLNLAIGIKKRKNEDSLIQFTYKMIDYLMKQGKTQQEIAEISGLTIAQMRLWKERYGLELGID